MKIKKGLVREFFLCFFIAVVSISMAKVSVFNSHFIFVTPWIFFCFFYNKGYGILSFVTSLVYLGLYNKWYFLLMTIVLFGLFFVKNILRFSNKKMSLVLGFYNFAFVFVCSIFERFIIGDSMYFLPFIAGVISYWLMIYYYELCFSLKGIENKKLNSSLCSFALIILGLAAKGVNIEVGVIDISFIVLLFLSFTGVKIGFEVGAVYTLVMLGVLFFYEGLNLELLVFSYTFILLFFIDRASRITRLFTYVGSVFLIINYFELSYYLIINYCLAGFLFSFIPKRFMKSVCEVCYGSEVYIEMVKEENKKFNLDIAKKIIKMEEIFSIVCEKIEVKERIKKSDKKLLMEEINMFDGLLKKFSDEIKENYNFDCNYNIEKEFYKYNVDLLDFKLRKNIFKRKIIEMDVRCEKNEIQSFVLPLVNKVFKSQFEVVMIKRNEFFGYYSLILSSKKRMDFKYGISQKSLDKKFCGDSYLVYENEDKYIFAISDGMGTGVVARESSKLALDLFKKFMDVGFDLFQTLKSLNCVLKSKYDKDNYTTLDLFVYDKYEEKFYFCKNGASSSYVVGEDMQVIQGNKLPLGIIDKAEFEFSEVKVNKGDCVVLASDGIGEIGFENICKVKKKEAQKISEILINKGKEIRDDKTVFVIKIC